MVSRVPMTSVLLLESMTSGECTEAAVALCGGRGMVLVFDRGGILPHDGGVVAQKPGKYEDDRREGSAKDDCSKRFEDDQG